MEISKVLSETGGAYGGGSYKRKYVKAAHSSLVTPGRMETYGRELIETHPHTQTPTPAHTKTYTYTRTDRHTPAHSQPGILIWACVFD